MMRFAMMLASGAPFFVGLGLTAVAPIARLIPYKPARPVAALAGALGAGLIYLSGTPMLSLIAIIGLVALIVSLLPSELTSSLRMRWVFGIATTFAWICAAALLAAEAPFASDPRLPKASYYQIAVIGDSLSAGIGGDVITWPARLAQDIGTEIRNLAVPGATVATAMRQVEAVSPDAQLVILLIGGNDVLSRTPVVDFERDLDALLQKVTATAPVTLMFELPTLCISQEYLETQRRIAARHRVRLIPRRHLAMVLSNRNSTVDGLHLSDQGHQQVADVIRAILDAGQA